MRAYEPLTPMPPFDSPLADATEGRGHDSDRVLPLVEPARPDALEATASLTPRRAEPREAPLARSGLVPTGPRDTQMLLTAAQLRCVAYAHLHALVFPDRDRSVMSRRVSALSGGGWLTRWSEPTLHGGAPRFVVPTRRGLEWAWPRLEATATSDGLAPLITLMRPTATRHTLTLRPGERPSWFRHQWEINALVVAWRRCPAIQVRWASSRDQPFPHDVAGVPMPQPDGVLIVEHLGRRTLVLLEHDRGHESLAHWQRAKVDRYAALAALPHVATHAFGVERFMVLVTVLDVLTQHPTRRLTQLADSAARGGAGDVMAFALAGAVAADPWTVTWMRAGQQASTTSILEMGHSAT